MLSNPIVNFQSWSYSTVDQTLLLKHFLHLAFKAHPLGCSSISRVVLSVSFVNSIPLPDCSMLEWSKPQWSTFFPPYLPSLPNNLTWSHCFIDHQYSGSSPKCVSSIHLNGEIQDWFAQRISQFIHLDIEWTKVSSNKIIINCFPLQICFSSVFHISKNGTISHVIKPFV